MTKEEWSELDKDLAKVAKIMEAERAEAIKRNELREARAYIRDGMELLGERTVWQNELLWWLCKAVLMLIEREVVKNNGKN